MNEHSPCTRMIHKSVKHSVIFLRGKKIYSITPCVCVSVWACVHGGECAGRPEESTGSLEARVTGGCEQFNVGARKTPVFCKSSKCFNHKVISPDPKQLITYWVHVTLLHLQR